MSSDLDLAHLALLATRARTASSPPQPALEVTTDEWTLLRDNLTPACQAHPALHELWRRALDRHPDMPHSPEAAAFWGLDIRIEDAP